MSEWAVMEGGGSPAGEACGRKMVGAKWAGPEGVGLSLCCQRGVSGGFSAEKQHGEAGGLDQAFERLCGWQQGTS